MARSVILRILISISMGLGVFGCGADNTTDKREDPAESDPLNGRRFGDDAYRCEEPAAQLTAGEPTYTGEIEPLIKTACLSCHVKGATSPDLSTYELLKGASAPALDQISQGMMPPSGVLSADQQALFKSWIDGGMLQAPAATGAGEPKNTTRCGTVPAAK